MKKVKRITAVVLAAAVFAGCAGQTGPLPQKGAEVPPAAQPASALQPTCAPQPTLHPWPTPGPDTTVFTLRPEDEGRVPEFEVSEYQEFSAGVSERNILGPYANVCVRQGNRKWFLELDPYEGLLGVCRKDPDTDWAWVGSIPLDLMMVDGTSASMSFWSETEGAVLLVSVNQMVQCFTTRDGGSSWIEMPVCMDFEHSGCWPSGMGFTSAGFGVVCWNSLEDHPLQIQVSRDGANSWQMLEITETPPENKAYGLDPLRKGDTIVLPIVENKDGQETMRYFLSRDEGVSWAEEKLDGSCPLSLEGWQTLMVQEPDPAEELGASWREYPLDETARAQLKEMLNTGDWHRIPPPEFCTGPVLRLKKGDGETLSLDALKVEMMAAVETQETDRLECWGFSGDPKAIEQLAKECAARGKDA